MAAAILPLLLAMVSGTGSGRAWRELATGFGLTAGALIFLQFLSSGRYESLSGRVGIDRTMGFHRIAAYALFVFAVLHPLSYLGPTLIDDPTAAWRRLTSMLSSNRLRTGVVALALLFLVVGFATIRTRPFVRYEYWRVSHGLLATIIAALTLHHIMRVGSYSSFLPLRSIWWTYAAVSLGAVAIVYFVRPWRMWREQWQVDHVTRRSPHVIEMILRGPHGTNFTFDGGQFIWMTLAPHRPPFHDHPFSLASAPSELPMVRLLVRESGDCTNLFGSIPAGTRVGIDGPHGSFTLPASDGPVIMVAGGVGVAPLLGILEQAAAAADQRHFRLLYAARTPGDLAGLDRLQELQSHLDLSLVCLADEHSERAVGILPGPIKKPSIASLIEGIGPETVTALVCGPPSLMELVTDGLLEQGVPARAIRYERFDYAGGRGLLDRLRRRDCFVVFVSIAAAVLAFALR